jgi:hypothetical protein
VGMMFVQRLCEYFQAVLCRFFFVDVYKGAVNDLLRHTLFYRLQHDGIDKLVTSMLL